MILVTAAIIEKENKFLITQRPNDGRSNGDRWEFPGGKVESNEDMHDCLKREIMEELGVEIYILEEFCKSVFEEIELVAFKCKMKGEIKNKDIQAYAWVSDFSKYDICEADLPIVNKLLQRC